MDSNRRVRTSLPVLLSLLALSILINYVDRGNLSVAAPLLKDELRLSATQIGVLITAFFWSYTAVLAISGWILDRVDVNWVLAGGFALWSLATTATGFIHGFAILVVARVALGAAESIAFPSYGKIIALHVPEQHRGIANAIIMSGMSAGPAIGIFACGTAMAHYGWRPVFIVIGLASLLWLAPWLRYRPDNRVAGRRVTAAASTLHICRQRNFWAAAAGHFCSNYPFYWMLVWLPLYLVRERHETMQQMARQGAVFYLMFALMAPLAGWVADLCIRRGAALSTVRKTCMAVGHGLVALGVLALAAADPRLSFAGLIIMGSGCGFVGPNIYAFAQTLAGPSVAGKWTGLQNCLGNFAGIVVGPLTGFIVDRTGYFALGFAICAAVAVCGGMFWTLALGPLKQIAWPAEAEKAKVRAVSEAA